MSNPILLIADEGSTAQQLLAASIRAFPACDLYSADNREKIQALRKPAVIVLDLMMEGESAHDVLRWLRAERRYDGVPIFILGSEILKEDVNEAYQLGADSCLVWQQTPEEVAPIAQGIATYASLLPGSGSCPHCA